MHRDLLSKYGDAKGKKTLPNRSEIYNRRMKSFQDHPIMRENSGPRRKSLYPSPPTKDLSLGLMDSCLEESLDSTAAETSRVSRRKFSGALTSRQASLRKSVKNHSIGGGSSLLSQKISPRLGPEKKKSPREEQIPFSRSDKRNLSYTTSSSHRGSLVEAPLINQRSPTIKPQDLCEEDRTTIRRRVREKTQKYRARLTERYKVRENELNDQGFLSKNANAIRMQTMKGFEHVRYKKNVLPHVFQGEIQELMQDKALGVEGKMDSVQKNIIHALEGSEGGSIFANELLLASSSIGDKMKPGRTSFRRSSVSRKLSIVDPTQSLALNRKSSMSPRDEREIRNHLKDIITNPFVGAEKPTSLPHSRRQELRPLRKDLSKDFRVVSIKNFEKLPRQIYDH